MNAIVFVSILASFSSAPVSKDVDPDNSVSIRSLIQGSGTVITFEHPADMLPRCPSHSAGRKGQDCSNGWLPMKGGK